MAPRAWHCWLTIRTRPIRERRRWYGSIGSRTTCPPIRRHGYFFKLFALDGQLPDLHEPTKKDLERAMDGHILAQATTMGTFGRQG